MSSYPNPDDLYQQGLDDFNRGDWQAATAAFTELMTLSNAYPGVEALLADARLKAHFEGAVQPTAKAPPRRRGLVPLAVAMCLLLVVTAGYFAVGALGLFRPTPVQAVVLPTETPAPPATATATRQPIVLTATRLPSPTVLPTPVQIMSGTVSVVGAEGTTFVTAPDNIQIIIDASGSMYAEAPGTGKRRWEVAREALGALVTSGTIPLEARVGVRTYGRNRGDDCSDVEIAHPVSLFSIESVLNVVTGIKPAVGGKTPIGASLRAAADDLQALEGSSVIILMTDGIESCDGDPISEAELFVGGGPNRQVHVVGFNIDTPGATAQLRDVAARGNGLYFDANDSTQLADALKQAVELTYTIVTPDGKPVTRAAVGDAPLPLAAGTYVVRINANPPIERELVVEDGAAVEVQLGQGAGGITAEIEQ